MNIFKSFMNVKLVALGALVFVLVSFGSAVQAQNQEGQSKQKRVRVQSIGQKLIKDFEALAEFFEAGNNAEAIIILDKIAATPELNNIERMARTVSPIQLVI